MIRVLYYLSVAFLVYYLYRTIKRMFVSGRSQNTTYHARQNRPASRWKSKEVVDVDYEIIEDQTEKK